jgi:hypothetical protein
LKSTNEKSLVLFCCVQLLMLRALGRDGGAWLYSRRLTRLRREG